MTTITKKVLLLFLASTSIARADWNGRWQGDCESSHSIGGKKKYSFAIKIEERMDELFFSEVGLTYLPTVPVKIKAGTIYENGLPIGRSTPQFLFVHRRQPTGTEQMGSIADYSAYLRLSLDRQKLHLADLAFWEKDGSGERSDCTLVRRD